MTEYDIGPIMALENDLFGADAWSESMLRSEFAEPTRHYVVACRDDTAEGGAGTGSDGGGPVLGYAGLRSVPPEGDVQTIAVDRAWWGRGIATALLTELLTRAYSQEVTDVFLEVRSDNRRAQELYRRFGFVDIGVRRNYYRDADAIVMRCSQVASALVQTGGGEVGEAPEAGSPDDPLEGTEPLPGARASGPVGFGAAFADSHDGGMTDTTDPAGGRDAAPGEEKA
ncbi:ribosomal protein S18-alanine N-acetyltransferase [Streptomonospora sp. NEAU-YY374]|nr:ribosomal protein S18-alanine N-acetyltransferase [Streptomonospora nanhaiensis]MBX9387221.1 ribosomal protein S18-alanine N-acetyltransferase [Streptomonospora nanhaiensis]